MIRARSILALLAASLFAAPAAAQQRDWSKVELKTQPGAEGIHMIEGAGGNIGVCSGEDGVFLIDDQFAPLTDRIKTEVAKISPLPIRFLLNTHHHGDHVGGNENLGKSGVLIVAHDNVRTRLATEQIRGDQKIPPSPREALPVVTFNDSVSFHLNGHRVLAFHVAPAHTDGDAVVWFPGANVMHLGDCFFNGRYPVIDAGAGGSLDGMIAAADRLMPMMDDRTRLIPGHGPLGDRAAYRAFRDMLAAARDRIRPLVQAGKTADEIVAAKPTAALDEKWGQGGDDARALRACRGRGNDEAVAGARSTRRARPVYRSAPRKRATTTTGEGLPMWSTIETKVRRGERLTPDEGVRLLGDVPLLELGSLANEVRARKTDPRVVTYVVDTNPNYTNLCTVDCHFCAFYRKPGAHAADAYTHDVEGVMRMMEAADRLGATTVLLQGGLNPEIPWEFYPAIVREARRRYPHITPHFFSAPEIHQMVEVSGLSIRGVLEALYQAGQRTLPGGGAEILAPRVRKRISVKKGGPEAWIEVHRAAHQVGMRSTATMMYGHVETDAELIEHLTYVRDLQDETGGFTAFVPWSYKRGNTPMEAKVKHVAGASRYFRVLAASRLYLDNFDHIQASWFSEGKKTGQISLQFGADDFGGTLYEENVHLATGHVNKTTVAEVETLIREAGFTPAQRTTLYEIVRIAEGPEALERLSAEVPVFVEALRERPPEYPERLDGEEAPSLVMPK